MSSVILWPVSLVSSFFSIHKVLSNGNCSWAPLQDSTSLGKGNHLEKQNHGGEVIHGGRLYTLNYEYTPCRAWVHISVCLKRQRRPSHAVDTTVSLLNTHVYIYKNPHNFFLPNNCNFFLAQWTFHQTCQHNLMISYCLFPLIFISYGSLLSHNATPVLFFPVVAHFYTHRNLSLTWKLFKKCNFNSIWEFLKPC